MRGAIQSTHRSMAMAPTAPMWGGADMTKFIMTKFTKTKNPISNLSSHMNPMNHMNRLSLGANHGLKLKKMVKMSKNKTKMGTTRTCS